MIKKRNGFTLIELLVVIAILAVLSTIAVTSFRGVQQKARDTQRKENVNNIAKVYEGKYKFSGLYQPITAADFTAGFPTLPGGATFTGLLTSPAKGFQICAPLEGNSATSCDTSSETCYCKQSVQGQYLAGGAPTSTPTPTTAILPTNTPTPTTSIPTATPTTAPPTSTPTPTPSCDSTGTLGNGLVGHWKFDEGSGSTATDSSGSGNNGTIVGATRTTGKLGSALSFSSSGNANYVSISGSGSLQNITDSSFTFTAWAKPSSLPPGGTNDQGSIISRPGYHTTLGYSAWGQMIANVYDTTDTWVGIWSWSSYSVGAWYQVTGVVNTSTDSVKVYVNGVFDGETTNLTGSLKDYGQSIYTIGTSSTGLCSNDWSYCYSGLIDDVRIYNRPLTTTEITSLYNGGAGCPR